MDRSPFTVLYIVFNSFQEKIKRNGLIIMTQPPKRAFIEICEPLNCSEPLRPHIYSSIWITQSRCPVSQNSVKIQIGLVVYEISKIVDYSYCSLCSLMYFKKEYKVSIYMEHSLTSPEWVLVLRGAFHKLMYIQITHITISNKNLNINNTYRPTGMEK